MNKEQRKRVAALIVPLAEISEELGALADEQQEKFDNANEGLQATEKFQAISEEADTFYSFQGDVEDLQDSLQEYAE